MHMRKEYLDGKEHMRSRDAGSPGINVPQSSANNKPGIAMSIHRADAESVVHPLVKQPKRGEVETSFANNRTTRCLALVRSIVERGTNVHHIAEGYSRVLNPDSTLGILLTALHQSSQNVGSEKHRVGHL